MVVVVVVVIVVLAMVSLDRRDIGLKGYIYNCDNRGKETNKIRKEFQKQGDRYTYMFKCVPLSPFDLGGHFTLSDKSGPGASANGCRLWAVSKFASNVMKKNAQLVNGSFERRISGDPHAQCWDNSIS